MKLTSTDIARLYYTAESLNEQFDNVRLITAFHHAEDLAIEMGCDLAHIDDYPTVREFVDITSDNILVVIDVPRIDDGAEFEAIKRIATSMAALSEGRGRVYFSPPIKMTPADNPYITH